VTASSVAFISNHGTMGGGEVMVVRMAAAASTHHDVTVVGPQSPNELRSSCELHGIRYTDMGGQARVAYLGRLCAAASQISADLLWCNGGPPALATTTMRARRVVHVHRAPSMAQAPFLAVGRRGALATFAPSAIVAATVPGAAVLPNWTENPTVEAPTAAGRPPERIGFLGRLAPEKGVVTLANAIGLLLAKGADVRAVMAGDFRFVASRRRREVEAALDGLNGHVERLGWISRDVLLESIDVLVVPSIWEEPFGLVAAEAMAAGVPLVVSDAGALPEVVGSGYPWVFRRGDAGSLATVLQRMRANPDAVEAARLTARRRWEQEYSPAAGTPRFLEALEAQLGA